MQLYQCFGSSGYYVELLYKDMDVGVSIASTLMTIFICTSLREGIQWVTNIQLSLEIIKSVYIASAQLVQWIKLIYRIKC